MKEDPLSMTEAVPQTTTLTSEDGLALFCRSWFPAEPVVASVLLIHGLGEHSGRYQHVAEFFLQSGFAVFAIDLRGHGHSDGQRGHVDQYQEYLTDVKTLIDYVRQQTPGLPRFLVGHSLGGLIVLTYALTYSDDITAVIASAPAVRNRIQIPVWKATFNNIIATIGPTLSFSNEINPELLSHDQAVVQAYQDDPLVHDQVTPRWFAEYTAAAEWTLEEANTLAVPALILQGGDDMIVDPTGSQEFFDRIGLEDKYYIQYEGLYHEIFNEPGYSGVLGDVEAWLVPRLQSLSLLIDA